MKGGKRKERESGDLNGWKKGETQPTRMGMQKWVGIFLKGRGRGEGGGERRGKSGRIGDLNGWKKGETQPTRVGMQKWVGIFWKDLNVYLCTGVRVHSWQKSKISFS